MRWKSVSPKVRVSNCWCKSTNLLVKSFNTVSVTGLSLMKALDFPCAVISLLMISSSAKSISCSLKKEAYCSLLLNSKIPSIKHFLEASLQTLLSARSPKIRPRAPMIILLPAPVSPVITESWLDKSILN